MATIKDVAAAAGVSFTTVSHVVNNTRPVSASARAKVERAIRQLDYVPSAVARSLKARSTATIGLVVPNSTNPYFSELAHGVEEACMRRGYCVLLCHSGDDLGQQQHYLRVLQEKRIDGLIVASAGDDTILTQLLGGSRTPLVIVDRHLEGLNADLVQIDHEYGAYLATQHLLELGHVKLGCIAGPVSTAVSAMRVKGFQRALAQYGVPLAAGAIIASDFSGVGGHRAAGHLFDTLQPSAIFASNDMMAIGALRAAAERGIRVPEACSIIGFDALELGCFTYPSLSTVGQPVRLLGESAAHTLLERISQPALGLARQRIVTPELVVRESTGRFVSLR
ncbi:LacI family DNA-binding transcriptional regulator [Paraburkholderia bonniea]|uniref:LacI family DNA-binding transcriptional regulator n=1 Tax=Paraburkholderia bonniea TaxID=2152891 RepID=UPI0012918457|nr:LacI family DNA-binding transcriptional regulator [Paraburkholderia bonniea]WJF89078.1 LacI family DNA-binding transcriptional regulator [Paraburkholderia bonniea]WJF92394.1 LacI family DNA-binding transcriptional regulator [Paraburkholderia bonniea]